MPRCRLPHTKKHVEHDGNPVFFLTGGGPVFYFRSAASPQKKTTHHAAQGPQLHHTQLTTQNKPKCKKEQKWQKRVGPDTSLRWSECRRLADAPAWVRTKDLTVNPGTGLKMRICSALGVLKHITEHTRCTHKVSTPN